MMRVRPARCADAPAIGRVHAQSWHETYPASCRMMPSRASRRNTMGGKVGGTARQPDASGRHFRGDRRCMGGIVGFAQGGPGAGRHSRLHGRVECDLPPASGARGRNGTHARTRHSQLARATRTYGNARLDTGGKYARAPLLRAARWAIPPHKADHHRRNTGRSSVWLARYRVPSSFAVAQLQGVCVLVVGSEMRPKPPSPSRFGKGRGPREGYDAPHKPRRCNGSFPFPNREGVGG